ncbi:MAG: YCF48-related protein [Pseudomonadota bacterium]
MTHTPFKPRHAAMTLLALAALCGAARAEPDVLERPALPSAKAAASVLLALAQAGPRLVAAGERGIILWSDDGGASWRQASVPVSVSLTALRFTGARDGWALGHSGVLLRTRDGGQTWVKQLDGRQAASLVLNAARAAGASGAALADAERLVADGPSKPFLDLHFFDAAHGLLVGAFGLLFATDDGGQTWLPAQQRIDNPKGKHLYAIAGDGSECVIAGEQGAVFRSTDGGKTFATLSTGYEGSYFGAIALAPRAALVFGMRGNVRWSDNAGASWHRSDIPAAASITAGLRLRDASLLLADETGQLYRSTDDGKNFVHLAPPRPSPFTAVLQTGDGKLLLSGMRGITSLALNQTKVQP